MEQTHIVLITEYTMSSMKQQILGTQKLGIFRVNLMAEAHGQMVRNIMFPAQPMTTQTQTVRLFRLHITTYYRK